MKVNFINSSYKRFYSKHKEEINEAVLSCIANGDFILRDDVKEFEYNLAKYVGVKYAVGVNSGTDALFLSLKALGIKKGDEVICPSHTFIACLQVIVHCGATPILVDVQEDGLMDTAKLDDLKPESIITAKTRAIMPVHLSGKVCDMKKITKLVERHNSSRWGKKIDIIEDACQALGAMRGGIEAGAFGITGCFSFISPKSLGGISDGGAIVTNNKEIYEKLLLLRNHWNITQNALLGYQPIQPEIMDFGWNSRLGNVTSAFLNVKFKYYGALLIRRKEIAEIYNKALKGISLLELPSVQNGQIWSEYIVNVENQKEFQKYLEEHGIETLVRDTVPNHLLSGLNLSHFKLPVTEMLAKKQVRLPIYPEILDSEIEYIIKIIKKYYA